MRERVPYRVLEIFRLNFLCNTIALQVGLQVRALLAQKLQNWLVFHLLNWTAAKPTEQWENRLEMVRKEKSIWQPNRIHCDP